MKYIRIIRRIFQILFLLFTIIITLHLINSTEIIRIFNYLHIIPGLSKIADFAFSPYLLLFSALLLITLLFGRLYCSFLCPIGFLQDIAVFVGKKLKIPQKPVRKLLLFKTLLLIIILVFIFIKLPLYAYIDHFSNMISFINHGLNPFLSSIITPFNNTLYDSYGFTFPEYPFIFHFSFIYSILFLFILFAFSVFYPRSFCNTICPSGIIYSFISRISFLNIKRQDACRLCRQCDKQCPIKCIDNGIVDKGQCIMCFDCLGKCPFDSLKLSFSSNKFNNEEKEIIEKKRRLIKAGGLVLFTLGTSFSGRKMKKGFFEVRDMPYVFPPGGGDLNTFAMKCTNCALCMSVCPMKVIRPIRFENGGMHRSLPGLDFQRSYCSYDCNVCLSICPMNALKYHPLSEKQVISMGKAEIDTDLCIPYKHNLDCGACAEHCPTLAINMKHLGGGVFGPVMEPEYCIGCGICQYACPLEKKKAINVRALSTHQIAYHRESEPVNDTERREDFPF